VWDVSNGSLVNRLDHHSDAVRSLPHGYQDVQETVQKPSSLTKLMPNKLLLAPNHTESIPDPLYKQLRAQVV